MNQTASHPRVLIIEDDPGYQSLLAAWFQGMPAYYERQGFPTIPPWDIVKVSMLADALVEIQKAHDTQKFFWIVILDLGLPDAKGLDGILRLREFGEQLMVPKYCPPVLIVTGSTDNVTVTRLHSHAYLLKSQVDRGDFYKAVEQVISDHAGT